MSNAQAGLELCTLLYVSVNVIRHGQRVTSMQHNRRLIRIVLDMEVLQLDKLFETELAQSDALARILPSRPRQVLRTDQ